MNVFVFITSDLTRTRLGVNGVFAKFSGRSKSRGFPGIKLANPGFPGGSAAICKISENVGRRVHRGLRGGPESERHWRFATHEPL